MVIAKLIRLCLGIVKKVLKVAAVFILCLVILSLIPNLPPYIEYNAYNVTPPVPLKGALGINNLLNNAEKLYEGMLKGPEAFDVYNGVLYTGLHGGEIVKFVDGKLVPVAKFGHPCEGFWEEKKCGRPLGIKFGRDGFLYVADAYYGLFKVNVDDGTKIQLVSVNDLIKDKPVKFPNAVDVAEDGTVYWTISSSEFNLEDGIFDLLADGSGRLLRYDPKKKINEVLIDNLHFANGVVLSSNEEFVLVAETVRSKIHRYYLKGPKKGVHDIFLDGLPGLPDNLKSDGSSGFFIPLVLGRDSSNPVLFQILGPFPSIRRALSRFLALGELLFFQIDSVYPNYYAKRAIHFIGHFESMHGIGPKRITILHVDENGKIKSSYHGTNGKLTGISEIHWFNGAFYLGSPYNTFVGRVVLDVPELLNQKRLPAKEEPLLKKQAQDQGQLKKQTKQEQEKRPKTEQKLAEPTVQQKYSAQDKKPISSDIHQQKQLLKEEKVPVKQQKEEKKEQIKPVQQTKQPLQQQKEQPKVQVQTPQKKSVKEEKVPLQQKPNLQQSKETVNEGRQSAGQEKPQPATPKPPVQQQKQQPTEAPKPAAHQHKQQQQQQQQRPAEVPKAATHQQKQQQQQQPVEVPKTATHQQKQQQQQRPVEVPKAATHKQPAEAPKPAQQKQQQQQATGVPKSPSQQQKRQSGEALKPVAEQQRQQQRSAEIPKSAPPQQKQQQKHSTDVPKPAVQQKQQEQKLEVKQAKELNEKKTVSHQKPQAKEPKPQVQQQRKPIKEEALPVQQKEQPVKHKPAVQPQSQPQESKSQKPQQQQQKYQIKEEQPITQQQKKTADQKAANQQEPVTVQKASDQQPVSQVQGKKSTSQEKSSPQQEQPSKTSHQKPKVQDKISTKEQHPPK